MQRASVEVLPDNVIPITRHTRLASPKVQYAVAVLKGSMFSEELPIQAIGETLSIYGMNHPWIKEWLLSTNKSVRVMQDKYDFVELNKLRQYLLRKGIPTTMRNNSCLVMGPLPDTWIDRLINEAFA